VVRMNGRIGVARRIHILSEYIAEKQYGVSLCGSWAGHCVPTEEDATCYDCIKLNLGMKR